GAGATPVSHALYLLDPDPTPAWAPFAGARPLCELRAGAHLIRERWETFVGAEAAGIFALPHLAGFTEPGVPPVGARQPVNGPVVIGSSTFAPCGLAPALPDGAFRLTSGGITVGWGAGPGGTWDGPQPHAAAVRWSSIAAPKSAPVRVSRDRSGSAPTRTSWAARSARARSARASMPAASCRTVYFWATGTRRTTDSSATR